MKTYRNKQTDRVDRQNVQSCSLFTNRKLHVGFLLEPKLVTLNDLERCNDRYFALFYWIWWL